MMKPKDMVADAQDVIDITNTNDANKTKLREFVYYLVSGNRQRFAVMRHITCLKEFFVALDQPDTEFGTLTKEQLLRTTAKLATKPNISPDKRRRILLSFKLAYRTILGYGRSNPPITDWIETKRVRSREKLPEELLTEDEVIRLIHSAVSLRDKAIIALLWDSGIRIGELKSLTLGNIDLQGESGHIQVFGKTGERKIPIIFSVPYLSSYLQLREGAKPSDPLIVCEGTWRYKEMKAGQASIAKMLKVTAKKAGIHKYVHPHLFRHSRATCLANKLTEPQMRAYFGWTKGSGMTSIYVHLNGRDIDDAFLVANGKKKPDKIIVQQTEKECQRCKKVNPAGNLYCAQCGAVLDLTTQVKHEADVKTVEDNMVEILQRPEVLKAVAELVEINVRKRRQNL